MDAEGSGDVPDRFSLLQQPSGELELLVVHLLWPSKADAALARVGAASTGALTDEVAFELSDAGEDGHDHLAGVRGGVGPGFGDGLKPGAGLADCFDDLEQVAGGASQPVELPYSDDISVAELIEHSVQLRPVAVGSGDLFPKDFPASGLLEGIELKSQPLILG